MEDFGAVRRSKDDIQDRRDIQDKKKRIFQSSDF